MNPYQVYALEYARRPGTASELFMQDGLAHSRLNQSAGRHEEAIEISYFTWAIVNAERTVVVDMGYSKEKGEAHGRRWQRGAEDGLRLIGIEPEAVEHMIVTHLHWDHVGNAGLYPNATFYLQQSELAFWTGPCARYPIFNEPVEADDIVAFVRLNLAGRVKLVDGSCDLFPGIRVHLVGGHTAGSQIVEVMTAGGAAVICSDAVKTYRSLREEAPDPLHHDIPGILQGYDLVRRLTAGEDMILPGHDPEVLERFMLVADGVALLE